MGDSMDEELERGGVSIAGAPGPLPFSNGYQHPQQQQQLAAQVEVAVATDHQRHQQQQQQQQQQQPITGWPRKRERDGEENSSINSFIPMMGATGALGRESPDSEMSSSSGSGGSDRSINRGIKRMRLNNQQQQQQQQQHPDCLHQQEQQQQQPQQQPHQGHHPLSAFDRFSPSSSAATGVLATTALHHPRPLPLGRAASSASTHDAPPTQAVQRSSSGGCGGTLHPVGGNPSGQQQRSQSFDSCVAFPPFPPRPPAQARYVRGIRVEADAPSDVDYSNVNHALRQLHMERRMMAAARGGGRQQQQPPPSAAGGGGGGAATGVPAPGGGWTGGAPVR